MKKTNQTKILFAGEGGQGVQTIAEALSLAASKQEIKSTYIPSFGVEQRGTPSIAYVVISNDEISYPRFETADILVVLSERAIDVVEQKISLNSDVIFDSSTIEKKKKKKITQKLLGLPATKYAKEKFHIKSYNVIIFGALTKYLKIDEKHAWNAISTILSHKFTDTKLKDINKEAFLFGREIIFENKDYSKPTYETHLGANIYKSDTKTATILPKYCKGCMICVLKCPVHALKPGKSLGVFGTPVPEIDLEKCIACGNCRKFCPDGAIGVDKIKK